MLRWVQSMVGNELGGLRAEGCMRLGCELEGDELHEARVCEALLLWIRTTQRQEICFEGEQCLDPYVAPSKCF